MSGTIEPDAAIPSTSSALHCARLLAKGERVERHRAGIGLRGIVFYSDHQLQLLVKWDDGTSSSLRLDKPLPWALRLVEAEADAA